MESVVVLRKGDFLTTYPESLYEKNRANLEKDNYFPVTGKQAADFLESKGYQAETPNIETTSEQTPKSKLRKSKNPPPAADTTKTEK